MKAIRNSEIATLQARLAEPLMKQLICLWEYDEYHNKWDTECGHAFTLIAGDPAENQFKFCPYCSRILEQSPTPPDSLEAR